MGCLTKSNKITRARAGDMGNNLFLRLEEVLGVRAGKARPLGGGCIGEVHSVDLENGDRVVVKVDRSSTPRLDVEGYMLQYLAGHSALPVPAVRHSSPGLLVMDFIEGDSRFGEVEQRHAAELLAALHEVRGETHGFERPTLIGALHQPNPPTDSWVAFFRDARLLYMADEALKERRLPREVHKRLRAFADRIGEFIEEPEYPSLLHGDVWTTNVLAHGGRITAFIDPAIYHGHPEIELAFTTLFGTFGPSFFKHYDDIRGIRPGFLEERRDIYNMYPLLVHVRLFGDSYLGGIDQTLRRLGF